MSALNGGVRLWLVRHGETEWSRALRHTGRTDLPLTDHGRAQATALAPRLREVPFVAIRCSPLLRARQTLELALPEAAPTLDDHLQERDYGVAEGRTTTELRAEAPGWDSWTVAIDGAETIDQVGARADRAIAQAVAAGESAGGPGDHDVLLVSHGHLLRVLAARWLGQPAVLGAQLALAVGTVSVLGFERERRALLRWNDAG
ncbi:putative phosphoglycerate mutase family protein [Patulibacter medicamentivorans]|uniref:Putative phosphoglycerate mutase family protein n=1 Tax=Patulibacter medicamentivorans TaxID=1097667 RepID=H0E422_9ACTN|nr:histidine phosphatase family protein [Patulibacter medicamentivorans]EHN11587.1 putative phosphoglycerate mutase family protein [Patulibacter medicamentivorans]